MFVEVFDPLPRRDVGVTISRAPDEWQVLTRSAEARTPAWSDLPRRRVPS